jgi:hypothetical protein
VAAVAYGRVQTVAFLKQCAIPSPVVDDGAQASRRALPAELGKRAAHGSATIATGGPPEVPVGQISVTAPLVLDEALDAQGAVMAGGAPKLVPAGQTSSVVFGSGVTPKG